MNFVDFFILVAVLGTLGTILYFNLMKKNQNECLRCPYKKIDCNCVQKKKKI